MSLLGKILMAACLITGFLLLATGDVSSQAKPGETSPAVTGITSGRARTLVIGVIGLVSLVIGWRAKALSARGTGRGRSWAIPALVLGGICVIFSAIHLITVTSGFGTGSGKAGAIVALVVGGTGMLLAGLALRPKSSQSP